MRQQPSTQNLEQALRAEQLKRIEEFIISNGHRPRQTNLIIDEAEAADTM